MMDIVIPKSPKLLVRLRADGVHVAPGPVYVMYALQMLSLSGSVIKACGAKSTGLSSLVVKETALSWPLRAPFRSTTGAMGMLPIITTAIAEADRLPSLIVTVILRVFRLGLPFEFLYLIERSSCW